ncbi:MAG: enoyl-CoA hydratase/isomerase family protein [Mycobacteriales bacterium]
MTGQLKVEAKGAILWLTIDREQRRNALSAELMSELLSVVRDPGADARLIVLAASGEQVFCSGADLSVMGGDATGLERHQQRSLLVDLVLAMRACPLPILARVQGLCLAGGVALVLGTDLVAASSEARFGLPEADLGLWPFIVSALLAKHLSPKHAMDFMLTTERIDADTACRYGLVSRVIPKISFDADFDALAQRIASKAPVAVRLGKAAFNAALESTLPAALSAMAAQLSLITTTRDAEEGITAFFEKRSPHWTGR